MLPKEAVLSAALVWTGSAIGHAITPVLKSTV
jgi:hypothetical protein